jgi:hypothetical protein
MRQNRRRRSRFDLVYPVRLYRNGDEIGVAATTQDISCEGFYCVSHEAPTASGGLRCDLIIQSQSGPRPSRLAHRRLMLTCQVEVVRIVSHGPEQGYGLACRIENYTIHPQVERTSLPEERAFGTVEGAV